METKYVVNNVPNQTITGNVTINGNLSVTGVTTGGLVTYKALLTQLGVQTGNEILDFNGGLIIGETYTVINYVSGDDFSNIANSLSGVVLTYSYSGTAATGITQTYTIGGVTSGEGSGIVFDITVNKSSYESVSIFTNGSGYASGDTITVLGTDVGGVSPDNDITIIVDSATSNNPNETGSVFIATGELPTNWNNGSELTSSGNLVVKVLENNIGYDIEWSGFFEPGVYVGFNSTTGPLYNNFNRNSTFVTTGHLAPFEGPLFSSLVATPFNFSEKDDSVLVAIFEPDTFQTIPDSLYYFPVEIQILKDNDTTPVIITGSTTTFPFGNVSVGLFCGDQSIQTLYASGGTVVSGISEVVTVLNADTNTSFLGVFSDDGSGGIILTMPTNLKKQFCANGTLTFNVFSD